MKLYVKYSRVKPYLPDAVADSKKELAEMLGIKHSSVITYFAHKNKTYQIIEVEDE